MILIIACLSRNDVPNNEHREDLERENSQRERGSREEEGQYGRFAREIRVCVKEMYCASEVIAVLNSRSLPRFQVFLLVNISNLCFTDFDEIML